MEFDILSELREEINNHFQTSNTLQVSNEHVVVLLKYPKHQLVRKEFMRASKLIDDAAAQRVDPDLVLDYICEPLPQVDM